MQARIVHELEAAGYHVVSADDGYKGIETARSQRPVLVICDYTLPGMSGDRVIVALKGDPATADIPVLIYSSQADPETVEACRRLGAADHIEKTGDYKALIDKVRDLLGEGDFEVEF